MTRLSRHTFLVLAVATLIPLASHAAWQITKPANGATVSPLKPLQRALAMMSEEQLDAFLNQEMVDRMADVTTYPSGIDVEWKAPEESVAGYRLFVARNGAMTEPQPLDVAGTTATLYNLEIGRTYFLQVAALDADGGIMRKSDVLSFTVEGTAPRVMRVLGVPNVRDLGGRLGLEGRMIPQGMIFRSAAFNDNSPDGGKTIGKTRISDENREAALGLGIKTEIDLRWDSELADMAASPLGTDVQYLRMPSTLYTGLFSQEGYENYRKLFAVFAKAENYPIDFHCILGADRTGSLAAVLLATLGVSREEIIRDYAFTSFYAPFLRPPRNIHSVLDGLAQCAQPGDKTLSDFAMRYLLRCGIKADDIYAFLTIVLGEGLAVPTVLKDAKKIEELYGRFSLPQEALAVAPLVVRQESMIQAGKEVSWALPVWYDNPLKASASDGNGAYLLRLRNVQFTATTLALQPRDGGLKADKYAVLAPLTNRAYCAPDGSALWSVADLGRFGLVLQPQEEVLLVIQPADALPEDYYALPYATPTFTPVFAVVPSAPAPVIDGRLDDATWQGAAPLSMTQTDGKPDANAPRVWLRTDKTHATLFLAVALTDASVQAKAHASRDASLWTEDSIEIFLSSHGDSKIYQIILSAADCIWDGVITKANDESWTIEHCEFKSARTPEGWTIEVAIPLAQLDLTGAVELNICANDNPNAVHYNLFTTGGGFSSRSAISPLLLK